MQLKEHVREVPLYKELYGSLIDQDDLDLEKLPELTKEHIVKGFPKNWISPFLKKIIAENRYEFMTTSGTTSERMQLIRPINWWFGEQKRFYQSISQSFPQYDDMQSKAILTTAQCSNTLCFRQMPPYEDRIINGILHLNISEDPNQWTKEDIQRMIEEIDRYRPQCMEADPIYLSIFFKFINKYNLSCPNWVPKLLILQYEYVTKKSLNLIKKYWETSIAVGFGTTETGFLYYLDDSGIIQPVSDLVAYQFKSFMKEKALFELQITSLRNPYMPLIKYNIKDLIQLDSNGNVIQFMGRARDFLNEKVSIGEIDNQFGEIEDNLLIYSFDLRYEGKVRFVFTTIDDRPLSSKKEISLIIKEIFTDKKIEFVHELAIKPAPSGKFELVKR